MEALTILSMNCRGLADRKKRRDVLNYIRGKNPDIVMLQDIHLDEKSSKWFILEWGFEGVVAPGTSRARGVAILFNNSFEYKLNEIRRCPNGNYILIDIVMLNQCITVGTIYGPNEDDPNFYRHLFHEIGDIGNEEIIIGGDWNLVLNHNIDYHNYRNINNPRARKVVSGEIRSFDLVDIWRAKYPEEHRFTWATNMYQKRARLDFFLISKSLTEKVMGAGILSGYRSDHAMISLNLQKGGNKRGKGLWKFNTILLKDKEYHNLIKTVIHDALDFYAALPYDRKNIDFIQRDSIQLSIPATLFLDTVLMIIRRETMKFAGDKRKRRREKERLLEQRIADLEKEIDRGINDHFEDKVTELRNKRNELEDIRQEIILGSIVRSRAQWHEHGERSSKYFLNLENRNYIEKRIQKLIKDDGKEIYCEGEILSELSNYYSKLYRKNDNEKERNQDWQSKVHVQKIQDTDRDNLEGCITYEELTKAAKNMKNNKSPGSDGFPAEFFKFFWKDLGHFILRSINESYDVGEFSCTQRQGIITCLPKSDRDKHFLKNWRPITLLNVIYKMASSCIANRLKKVIDKIVSEEQKGFIKGRYIGENVRLIYDIIHESNNQNLKGLLLVADFEKAFDTMSRDYILECLDLFGFGSSLKGWVATLMKNSTALVVQNGHLTNSFPVERGCRQGDPISPYLFVIGSDILTRIIKDEKDIQGIKINNSEYLIAQYADDTKVFLDGTETSLRATLNAFNFFYAISGLKINLEKTRAIWLGSMAGSGRKLCSDHDLNWTQGNFKVLGITFSTDLNEVIGNNYEGLESKIRRTLMMWRRRCLTTFGKVTIIKVLALSKLTYYLINLPRPPDNFLEKITRECFNFIWNGRKDKIKRKVMVKKIEEGGVEMMDLDFFEKSLKLTWIKRILMPRNTWKHLAPKHVDFQSVIASGGYIDSALIDKTTNLFWRQLYQNWNEFLCKTPTPMNIEEIISQPLWNNSKFSDKSFFSKKWHESGLKWVKNILNENGEILSFQEVKQKFRLDGHFLTYAKLLEIIPKQWKRIINTALKPLNLDTPGNNWIQIIVSQDRLCKYFYDVLVANKIQPSAQVKWEEKIGNGVLQWKQYYTLPKRTTKDVKLINFQYKILHRILPTNYLLHQMKIKNDNLCTFCKQHVETLEHLFVRCQYSLEFWEKIHNFLTEHKIRPANSPLSLQEILFGCVENNVLINKLIITAKKHIYFRKNKELRPSFEDWKNFVKMIKETEFYVACINMQKENFNSIWSGLLTF